MKGKLYLLLFFLFALGSNAQAQIGFINTVAGNGTAGHTGDGGAATSAEIELTNNLAVDRFGNIFIGGNITYVYGYYNGIRKVNTAGIISTIAGNGTGGFSGDGGYATAAELNNPQGVAVDAIGNLYISDEGNNRIRKVDTSGIITTIAGNGTVGYTGDGGSATAAEIGGAYIAVDDSGNVYIAGWSCCYSTSYGTYYRVRKISSSGIITTFAGTGSGGFSGDGGAATAAQLSNIYGLATDNSGSVYINDEGNERIRKVNTSGIISTIAGNGTGAFSGDGGPATLANLFYPGGIIVDGGGNLYIGDQESQRVRKVNISGIISSIAGTGTSGFSGDGGPATLAKINYPLGVAVDGAGNVYVADYYNARIRRITINNHAPYFIEGLSQNLLVCENSSYDSINSLLPVFDSDYYETETWSLLSGPSHGTAMAAYTTVSGCDTMHPHGLYYTPSTGYNGLDTFKVTVYDGYVFDTIAIYVTVIPIPGAVVGTTYLCAGATTTLSDTSAGGTWSSSASSGIATIGSTGVFSGISEGTAIISYTSSSTGCAATVVVTVNPIPPIPLISDGITHGCVGSAIILSDSISGGTWLSGSPAIATVGSSTGVITGVATGTTSLTYTTAAGCTITTIVTINPSPSPITGNPDICEGFTTTLSDSTTGGTWSSSTSLVAIVNSTSGLVTGIALGAAVITYTLPTGCIATKTVTVISTPSGIAGLSSLCAGTTIPMYDLTTGGAWSSGSPGIATVGSASGIVTGISSGTSAITYMLTGGCEVSTTIAVNPLPSVITGATIACLSLTDSLHDSIPGGAWSSSAYDTAFIDAGTGIVTGITSGPAIITYTLPSGCFTTTSVNVNSAPTPISGPAGVCVGSAISLSDGVSGGVWSSGTPGIATVGSLSGTVIGIAHGSATISYSTGTGCIVTFPITVYAAPAAISGPGAVCPGATITLTDTTTGGGWSSSASTTIATVSSGGVMTGMGAGPAIISYTIYSGIACAATMLVTVNPLPSVISAPHVCSGATTTLTDGPGGLWSCSGGSPLVATIGSVSGTVSGITPGTATVTYTLPTGCYRTAVLTVNPLPTAISGVAEVCVGLTTTLGDSPAGGVWSKSNTNINITGGGVVTGITTGTTDVTYTFPATGCYTTKTVTVNTSPGTISGSADVCIGSTITLTDPTAGGVWSVGAGSWGTVTIGSSSGDVTGIAAGPVTINYSLGAGCSTSKTITVNPLPSIITGTLHECAGGSTTLSDSIPIAIGSGVWYTTSTAATVGAATGVVTGVSGGAATITYTSPLGCTRTAIVTVNPLPSPIAGPGAVCVGATMALVDGGGVWSSSNPTIAPIGATTGIVTGSAIGTSVIDYTLPTGCFVSTTVTVSLSPTAITGPSTVCQGATISLDDLVGGGLWSSSAGASVGSLSGVVTGITPGTSTTITYSLGTGCTVTKTVSVIAAPAAITGAGGVCVGSSILLTDPAVGGLWHSSSGSATVGSTGTVTGVSAGSGNISYTVAATGCSAVAVVTVNPLPAMIGGPSAVCIGTSITETDTPIAIGAGGIWSTTSTGITVGSTGVVTGITSGVSLVTYTTGSCSITKAITVNTAPVITGATGLCTGTSTTLSGTGTGTWSTAPGGVVSVVAATGVVTGLATGTAIITFSSAGSLSGTGCSATTTVNVSTGPSSIGGTLHVCVGATTNLSDLASGGTWTITPTTTATIGSSSGVVTGVAPGVAAVTYSLGTGCTTSAMVTVNASPAGITGAPQVCVDATTTLSTTSTGGLWSSSPATIATVAPTGIVTGVSVGIATISYTVGGCSATKVVTVNATPSAITGVAAVCEGLTITLTDTTSGGIWSSASTLLAVDSVTGMVTGISIGTGIASYTLPTGCAATKPITVNSAPDAITGLTSVCIGSSTPLSDLTSGGSWSSPGTTGIVSLSPTGVVTGMGLGTATISYSVGAASCPAVITVTVNSLPGAISGSQNVCLSATDTLTDIPGGGIWSSSNVLVATVGSATGFVYGVAPGTATINYSLGVGCMVGITVTVHPAPAAISGSGGVCIGLTSTLTDIAGGGTWSSRDTAIAVISPTGVVTGRSGGDAVISYTVPISTGVNCAATTTITVNTVPPIEGVRNICASDTLHVSDSISGGAWTSTLVSISAGIVTSYIPGVAMLIYTLGDGCSTNAMLTVNPLPAPIVVSGGTTHICTGHTISLSDVTPGGVWNSSNTTVATVGSTGSVTTSGAGTAEISYAVPTGCAEHVIVTVDVIPSGGTISGITNVCVGAAITIADTIPSGIWSASNTTATITSGSLIGVAVGTDTISYSITNVCGTATITKTITINPLPDAGTINGVDSVCVGTNITLTNAVSGGAWGISNGYATISGTGIVTGVSAGMDTVNYRVTNSCGTAQTAFAVAVDPLPQTGTITGPTSVCIGELDTLTGAPGGGVWNSSSANATVIDGIVTGVSQGIDTIRYGFTNSCGTNATSYAVTIYNCDTITGVANVQMNKYANVEIYPNPTKGELNVINGAGYEIRILNLLGQEVLFDKLTMTKEALNIGQLTPGIYLVQLTPFDKLMGTTVIKRLVIAQ